MSLSENSFFIIDFEVGDYVIQIDNKIYDIEAIQSTVYKYTNKFYIKIYSITDDIIGVRFKEKIPQGKENVETTLHEFYNALVEYQIRFDLEKRFGNLREQIYQRAFAPMTKKNV